MARFKSIANPGTQLQLGIPLGAKRVPGIGRKIMNVIGLGVQWKATPQLVLRTGYSHGSNFTTAQNALLNILAPATTKNHIALGVGYDITPNWNVGLAYVHAFSNALNGYNQNDPTQSIKLHMVQDEVRPARHVVSDRPPPSRGEAPRQRLKKRGRSGTRLRSAGRAERGIYGVLVQSVIRATSQARTAWCRVIAESDQLAPGLIVCALAAFGEIESCFRVPGLVAAGPVGALAPAGSRVVGNLRGLVNSGRCRRRRAGLHRRWRCHHRRQPALALDRRGPAAECLGRDWRRAPTARDPPSS